MKRVIIRADGNKQTGLGHLARASAVSCMLRPEFQTTLCIDESSREFTGFVFSDFSSMMVISSDTAFLDSLNEDDIVVLDGYHLGHGLEKEISQKNIPVVRIDDLASGNYYADAIINPAGGLSRADYNLEETALLFTGPKVALLRPPFLVPVSKTERIQTGTVTLCFGGSDPDNLTQSYAAELLSGNSFKKLNIITGPAYSHGESLNAFLGKAGKKTEWHQNLGAAEIKKLFSHSDAVVCSASTVAYEACSCITHVICVKTADNQEKIATFLSASGLAHRADSASAAGNYLKQEVLSARLKKMHAVQRSHFDGDQTRRIRSVFRVLSTGLKWRRAQPEHSETILEWANDPETRRNSFSEETISAERHAAWYKNRIASSEPFLVFYHSGRAIGMVRIDRKNDIHTISVNISPAERGKGFGKMVLEAASLFFFSHHPEGVLTALIKKENTRSVQAFSASGFTFAEEFLHEGVSSLKMTSAW